MTRPAATIALTKIRIDGGTQPRCEINLALVSEYAEAMTEGETFPPAVVFFDGVDHWLADGFHRYHAASSIGLTELTADIRKGTQRDAILYSVGANADHGQRRTNLDKRRAVLILLNDAEWSGKGSGWIAQQARVSRTLVKDMIQERDASSRRGQIHVRRGDSEYVMNTENIGRREPAPQQITDMTPQRTLGPPSDGLQFARMAIADLEQIRDDDIQRDDAFALVLQWIDGRTR